MKPLRLYSNNAPFSGAEWVLIGAAAEKDLYYFSDYMTDTAFERKFIDGLADTVTNHTLEKLLHENFTELGVPTHTQEELAFADGLAGTYEGADTLPGIGCDYDLEYATCVKTLRSENGRAMNFSSILAKKFDFNTSILVLVFRWKSVV